MNEWRATRIVRLPETTAMDAATTGALPQWWLHLIAGSDGFPAAANRSTGSCFDVEPERPKIPAVLVFSSLHPRGVSSRGRGGAHGRTGRVRPTVRSPARRGRLRPAACP